MNLRIITIIFITSILMSCQTTNKTLKDSNLKFLAAQQKNFITLGFNLNKENFTLKTVKQFNGIDDKGDLLLLVRDDLVMYVKVDRLSDFMPVSKELVELDTIYSSYYEYEKENQLRQAPFIFYESYKILSTTKVPYLRFTYYAPNYSNSPDEVYKIINYSWINNQALISLYIPVMSPLNEDQNDKELLSFFESFKSVNYIITSDNIFDINIE